MASLSPPVIFARKKVYLIIGINCIVLLSELTKRENGLVYKIFTEKVKTALCSAYMRIKVMFM